jgi:hypothetical protein
MKRIINQLTDTNPKKEIKELTISDMLMIRGGGKVDAVGKGNV